MTTPRVQSAHHQELVEMRRVGLYPQITGITVLQLLASTGPPWIQTTQEWRIERRDVPEMSTHAPFDYLLHRNICTHRESVAVLLHE